MAGFPLANAASSAGPKRSRGASPSNKQRGAQTMNDQTSVATAPEQAREEATLLPPLYPER